MNSEEAVETPTAEDAAKSPEIPQTRFLGGTIQIHADAQTGGIAVNAPENLVIALGLLETAKAILIQRQQEAMNRKPAIVRGDPSQLKLLRPS